MIICVSWEESSRPGRDHERSQQKWRLACQYGGCVIKWEAGGGRLRGVWAVNLPGKVKQPEVSSAHGVFSAGLILPVSAADVRFFEQQHHQTPLTNVAILRVASWGETEQTLRQILNHRHHLVNSALNQKQKSFPLRRLTLVINRLIWCWVLRLIYKYNSIIWQLLIDTHQCQP